MPGWYVHIQAAAETVELLKKELPPGSPLTQQEADALFEIAHAQRNYLAAGAIGPDLFFLLPDFTGDKGKGLLAMVDFIFKTWKVLDDEFIKQWEQWMAPVMDNHSQLLNGISGGMLAQIGQIFNALSSSLSLYVADFLTDVQDIFGLLSSGTQTGYGDNTLYWSDMFHYRKTYEFARRLYANALRADEGKPAGEPSRVPKQQAFALGWISHCATDVAAHPFTNAKCGGPYRTHWQRHKVIENHYDALIYGIKHKPVANYDTLDTAALHFRLAFRRGAFPADPNKPDDVPGYDYFTDTPGYPIYSEGEKRADYDDRRDKFNVNTEPFPVHLCELLLKTMQEVYTDPGDANGPRILRWDPGKNVGTAAQPSGRPTVAVLQDMYRVAFEYAKFSSSAITPRRPLPPSLITDHDLPRPPGGPIDGGPPDLAKARPMTIVDILLAIVAWALYILQLITWVLTILPALLADLATFPLRELLYQMLVVPSWDLYMKCRIPLVMEGFLSPKPSEISMPLVQLGLNEQGLLAQLIADLAATNGFAMDVDISTTFPEPSGLDATRGADNGGYGLDPAYPRAMVMDLKSPLGNQPRIDADIVSSEFVAPWLYPDHNVAGMRNGWEAPRTHVGPYQRPDDAKVLMGGMRGSDVARRRYEGAKSPAETEAISAEYMPQEDANLGDPLYYGAYLMGQLTGSWTMTAGGGEVYFCHDDAHPLPDFNLDSDRGYAYLCWDYDRHAESKPPSAPAWADASKPAPAEISDDQWLCMPQIVSDLSKVLGMSHLTAATRIRDWYGYHEPITVPQRYDAADNPHHRSRYDPLKRLAHHYLPRQGLPEPPLGWDGTDLQVSEAEMRAVGMSTTGRPILP